MFDWIDRFLHNPTVLAFIGIAVAMIAVMWALDTVAAREPRETTRTPLNERLGLTLPLGLTWVLAVLWAVLFATLTIGMFWVILHMITRIAVHTPGEALDLRWYLLTLTALTAALSAVVALPFTLIRSQHTARQTATAEQAHVTDQINTAVLGLGAEKVVWRDDKQQTLPNLEVRIGAIYALERIAVHSHDDHIQIMEILCAYIRENAPASEARTPEQDGIAPLPEPDDDATPEDRAEYVEKLKKRADKLRDWARTLPAPRSDIRVALEVIGRRDDARIAVEHAPKLPGSQIVHYVPDLRATNLQGLTLSGDFSSARFDNSALDGSVISGKLNSADFKKCSMQGFETKRQRSNPSQLKLCDFSAANLSVAVFVGAEMSGSRFWYSRLDHTNFNGAVMVGSDLYRARIMQAYAYDGADFSWSRIASTSPLELKGIAGGPSSNLYMHDIKTDMTSLEDKFETVPNNLISELKYRADWHSRLRKRSIPYFEYDYTR